MKLEDIRKLCDEATPGPWEHHNWDKMEAPHVVAPTLWDGKSSCDGSFDVPRTYENAAFIAASRTLMPKLLAVAGVACELVDSGCSDAYKCNKLQIKLADTLEDLEKE